MNAQRSFAIAALLVAIAAIPAIASAQGTFEGSITFRVSGGRGGEESMVYSVKGDNVRMDMSAGMGMSMYTLYDGDKKSVSMVIPMRQMYMEYSMDNAKMPTGTADKKTEITWTGKKETVAGYECEHATITNDDGSQTDVCLAKDLGTFVQMGGGGMRGRGRGGPMGSGWEGHIGSTFPLKVERNGQLVMEATKIEKKTLDASMFAIPEGYHKMSMPTGGR